METLHPKIATKSATRHILKTFGLKLGKRLGQNFLIEPTVVDDIVAAAEIAPGEQVLEIGAGLGALTQGLLEAGATVKTVELDKKLPPILAHTLMGYDNLTIIQGDILKTDIAALTERKPFKVTANLPYYITTPIIFALLNQNLPITKLVFMIQKEVAERIVAPPSTKDYGSLSVAVNYYADVKLVRTVSPNCFMPPPNVESAVICLDVLPNRRVKVSDEDRFFRIVRASFAQRRKTLSNALKGGGFSPEDIAAMLARSGIDGSRRGETLSIDEFAALV